MKKLFLFVVMIIVFTFAFADPVGASKPKPIGDPLTYILVEDPITYDNFPADTPFHISHGWGLEEHPNISFKYELEWNGEIQKFDLFDIKRNPETGLWAWHWIYNFPEGLNGTHTFIHHWYAHCKDYIEGCDSNKVVEVGTKTQIVEFIDE